jgi:hypothetical protein
VKRIGSPSRGIRRLDEKFAEEFFAGGVGCDGVIPPPLGNPVFVFEFNVGGCDGRPAVPLPAVDEKVEVGCEGEGEL